MSDYKFKVGDRVEIDPHPTKNHAWDTGKMKGHVGVIKKRDYGGSSPKRPYYELEGGTVVYEDDVKTATDYQPIKPKVGDKFRVVKNVANTEGGFCSETVVGCTGEVIDVSKYAIKIEADSECSYIGRVANKYLTTEYLEPVEELSVDKEEKWLGKGIVETLEDTRQALNRDMEGRANMEVFHQLLSYGAAETYKKKSLAKRTMNTFKKALLGKDTKTLIRAGYMDDESLTLTSKGTEALDFILFEANKAALVKSAEEKIKEEENK